MNGKSPRPRISTSLDLTKEHKDLKREIAKKERQYSKIFNKSNRLKRDMSDFALLYSEKIGGLYTRLNELEQLLFTYRQISEYVDDIFSFSEAQKIFDEAMKDRRARMEEEYRKQQSANNSADNKSNMTGKEREELKRLYRKLARIFHPDKTGGEAVLMKYINKAYKEGNLEGLRNLDSEHFPEKENETIDGLQHRLMGLIRLIEKETKEIQALRRSDMYILKKKLLKSNTANEGNALESLANEIKKEIFSAEEEVERVLSELQKK